MFFNILALNGQCFPSRKSYYAFIRVYNVFIWIALSDEIFNKKVTLISPVHVLIKMVKYLFFKQKKDNKYGTMVRQ